MTNDPLAKLDRVLIEVIDASVHLEMRLASDPNRVATRGTRGFPDLLEGEAKELRNATGSDAPRPQMSSEDIDIVQDAIEAWSEARDYASALNVPDGHTEITLAQENQLLDRPRATARAVQDIVFRA
ncbi:hypothetical protein [Nocardioides sp. URHA0020]|uniref:hypothetical protein n=1 Tax=Nocardioides sp. URHA0020 TaxID=1380392 RepID=UPI000490A9FE|nr:hypothetical protein [Nocardioides sp. URHA0020]